MSFNRKSLLINSAASDLYFSHSSVQLQSANQPNSTATVTSMSSSEDNVALPKEDEVFLTPKGENYKVHKIKKKRTSTSFNRQRCDLMTLIEM